MVRRRAGGGRGQPAEMTPKRLASALVSHIEELYLDDVVRLLAQPDKTIHYSVVVEYVCAWLYIWKVNARRAGVYAMHAVVDVMVIVVPQWVHVDGPGVRLLFAGELLRRRARACRPVLSGGG